MGKKKHLSAFERGMVVGASRTGLCQELTLLGFSRSSRMVHQLKDIQPT
jgi:hypothetical protein